VNILISAIPSLAIIGFLVARRIRLVQKAATNAASAPAVWVTLTGSRELQNRGSARE
jgi:hypothetical protein